MQYLYIYPTIQSIGYRAFYDCRKFEGLSCHHTVPPTLANEAFKDCIQMWYIRVPATSMEAFKSAENWKDYDHTNRYGRNFYYEQ